MQHKKNMRQIVKINNPTRFNLNPEDLGLNYKFIFKLRVLRKWTRISKTCRWFWWSNAAKWLWRQRSTNHEWGSVLTCLFPQEARVSRVCRLARSGRRSTAAPRMRARTLQSSTLASNTTPAAMQALRLRPHACWMPIWKHSCINRIYSKFFPLYDLDFHNDALYVLFIFTSGLPPSFVTSFCFEISAT